jgi:glucokinase-like ROK family protein
VTRITHVPDEQLDGLSAVLDLIRSGRARTRPELGRVSGLGRSVVAQRVAALLEAGLVEEVGLGASTGGRAPRELRLRGDAGAVLVAALGAVSTTVGIADLAGRLLATHSEPGDIAAGPLPVLDRVQTLFDRLLADLPVSSPVCGVGVGLPGPVEFASGRPVSPPIMPGWDGYDVRGRLGSRYRAPVWVDNDVNVLALGELRAGLARSDQNVIYVKIGTGIGAGLVSGGRLHRGAQGCAGDIGHVAVAEASGITCRCGNTGCLEAVAGGAALARDGARAARDGRSPLLADALAKHGRLRPLDVTSAARSGDPVAVELLTRAGRLVGETLATLVNFFDPSLLLLGGAVAQEGDLLLAAVRETVYRRSLPLATRNLRIIRPTPSQEAGLTGASAMVVDELFAPARLATWLPDSSPAGKPELAGV